MKESSKDCATLTGQRRLLVDLLRVKIFSVAAVVQQFADSKEEKMKINAVISTLKSLPGDFSEEIENLQAFQIADADRKFRITNAGPMNPGKSTLFNAFLRKPEVFKTADARQTAVSQEENWGTDFRLVDTPGCNSVVFEDNKESILAFRKADLITFVHNINTGGLIKAELDILKEICNIFGREVFPKRVCIVCNRIDDAPDEETILRNRNEIAVQLKENLAVELKMFSVSPLNYLAGVAYEEKGQKEEAQIYYDGSNMKDLLDYVTGVRRALGKRVSIDIESLVKKLESVKVQQTQELQKDKNSLSRTKSSAKSDWKQTLENIRTAWDECC